MIKILRLWRNVDDNDSVTLLDRPRVSIKVDEYVWGLIEQNIVIPKKIMQSSSHDYELVVSLSKYSPEINKSSPFSPYNGALKENAISPTNRNTIKFYWHEDFVDGEGKTIWFDPEKFWINGGKKTALVSACSENVNQDITPIEYADLLFDAFAATLLLNFKKLKKSDFDKFKTHIDYHVICGFAFPAPFIEQKYEGDDSYFQVKRLSSDGMEEVLVDIPNIETYYKHHYGE